jgi:hypothetical protein
VSEAMGCVDWTGCGAGNFAKALRRLERWIV